MIPGAPRALVLVTRSHRWQGDLGEMRLTVTLLAKARQEFLHTFDSIASLMLSRTFLVLVVLKIGERLDHKLGTRTGGTSSMGDGRR